MEKPTFLVIGAQKCGTTSLYKYLEQHPDVFMSRVKELRFFSGEAASQEAAALDGPDIHDFETYCTYFEDASEYDAAGEVSPSYMFYPGTAERIRRHLPDVKLIAILRDPVERAFSEYWHHWKMGRRLDGNFLEFVRFEDVNAKPRLSEYQDCLRRGLYYRQLRPYFRLFNRQRLLILLYEDLKSNAKKLMQRVYEFIGVDPTFKPRSFPAYNKGKVPKEDWRYFLAQLGERIINWSPIAEQSRIAYRRRLRSQMSVEKKSVNIEERKKISKVFEKDINSLESKVEYNLESWKACR